MKINGFKDTIDWYDQNAKSYAAKRLATNSPESIKWFLEYLPDQPVVLDGGCGSGLKSKLLHELGARVTGLDISSGLLAEAVKAYPEINFVTGDLRSLPFKDQSFDGVMLYAAIVHLETIAEVDQVLHECFRVLKPEGKLYLRVKLQTGENGTEVITDSLSGHDRFFRYYKQPELDTLLENSGFKILERKFPEDGHGRTEVKWYDVIAEKI